MEDSAKSQAEHLRKLSREVQRISASLENLSIKTASPLDAIASATKPVTDIAAKRVNSVIRARRKRGRYFPEGLFADPVWDMLLELFEAEIAERRVSVSSLCIAAAVPPTTALRYISMLVEKGMFNRQSDPLDGRRVFVELSPKESENMRQYFADVLDSRGA